MDATTIALIISYIIITLLVYKVIKLEIKLKTIDAEHRKMVADAGIALTDTLKVAFDNMKKINQKYERLSAIVKDVREKMQNIVVGGRPNNQLSKLDKIARFRAAVHAAKEDQSILDDMEDVENER